jgi:hypothetical protein
MAGYSSTPLLGKLGVKEGHRVAVLGAPAPDALVFPPTVTVVPLPPDVLQAGAALPGGKLDVVLVFAPWRDGLPALVACVRPLLTPAGAVWICWPKKASRRPTDVDEDLLRLLFLPTGLVDNKVCAVDDVWSGLRFVVRRELRE